MDLCKSLKWNDLWLVDEATIPDQSERQSNWDRRQIDPQVFSALKILQISRFDQIMKETFRDFPDIAVSWPFEIPNPTRSLGFLICEVS